MRHVVRKRPEGRLQCTMCRASFEEMKAAVAARYECPGVPLAHGVPGQREHIVYPTWGRDRSCAGWGCEEPDPTHEHGPGSPLCDEITCGLCMHECDCDVCRGKVRAPGLFKLLDSRE